MCIRGLVYCIGYYILFCIFRRFIIFELIIDVTYVLSTYIGKMCPNFWLVLYVMPGCFALSCPKNFSVQSDLVLFCASDNKRLELKGIVQHCSVASSSPEAFSSALACPSSSSPLAFSLWFTINEVEKCTTLALQCCIHTHTRCHLSLH